MNIRLFGHLFMLLLLAPGAFAQTYHDENFATDWLMTILNQSPASATAFAKVVSSGGIGSTPAYRQVDHSNFDKIEVAHVYQQAMHDPAAGKISSIAYSYNITGIGLGSDRAVAYRLLLVQNGSYYISPIVDQVFGSSWVSFSRIVAPAGFTKALGKGPDQPDLSCTGAPVTFGYFSANSTGTSLTFSTSSGIDNWQVKVNVGDACPPDPCCPPWNSSTLEDMLVYQGSGGIAAPYKLLFQPTPAFQGQLQAYINYLSTLNLGITSVSIEFKLNNAGNGPMPIVGTQIGPTHPVTWTGSGPPIPPINFFNNFLQVNKWYRISTVTSLNNGISYFPRKCVDNQIDVRIQVLRSAAGGAVIQFRRADGHVVEKKLP
jgi:hypothetical protein